VRNQIITCFLFFFLFVEVPASNAKLSRSISVILFAASKLSAVGLIEFISAQKAKPSFQLVVKFFTSTPSYPIVHFWHHSIIASAPTFFTGDFAGAFIGGGDEMASFVGVVGGEAEGSDFRN
jgi:hypothetical protein